jgi:hypothetical protein
VFSFGRADPERMPKGKPMNLVTLLCSVDNNEIEGVAAAPAPPPPPKEKPKDTLETYAQFKTRIERELVKLLNEEHADHFYYVRINKKKASILLQGQRERANTVFPTIFAGKRELIMFVKQKAPDLNSGKFKEIFFFLEQGYIVIRKGSRIDYVVLIGSDQNKANQGRLLAARVATFIRKSAIERRNKRVMVQTKQQSASR